MNQCLPPQVQNSNNNINSSQISTGNICVTNVDAMCIGKGNNNTDIDMSNSNKNVTNVCGSSCDNNNVSIGPGGSVNNNLGFSPRQRKFQIAQKNRFLEKKNNKIIDKALSINRLSIVHINSLSALKKLDDLESLADQTGSHVLCVSETWFRDDIHYKLVNYENVTSKSSKMKNGAGGASIYVRRDVVKYFKLIDLSKNMSSGLAQIIGIESVKLKLKIYCTYRSPSMKTPAEVNKYLTDIQTLKLDEAENWIMVGDINMPTAYGAKAKITPDKKYRSIYEYFVEIGADQIIDEPTHKDGNTLDVFLCSTGIDVLHSKSMPYTDWKSDHFPIHMIMELEQPMYKEEEVLQVRVMNMAEADFDGYRRGLRENKERLKSIINETTSDGVNLDVNLAAVKFSEAIIEIFEEHVKFKWITPGGDHFSKEVRDQIKVLQKINKQYHRRRHEVRVESKKLSKLLKIDRKDRALERLERIRDNDEPLYRYFDQARSGERRVGPFVDVNSGELTESVQEAVDLLCGHYKNSMNPDGEINVDPFSNPEWWDPTMDELDFNGEIQVTEEQVRLAMSKVRRKVGKGPDNISGYMIKEGIDELVELFHMMFQNMVSNAIWPECYKEANITPVPKIGRKDLVDNTRPISLTSVIGKIFERLLAWNFLFHLKTFKNGEFDIKRNQFGFCENRSVNDNLTEVLHRIYTMLNAKKSCELILCDLSKAFDLMHHSTFLEDLKNVGVVGKHLNLWKSWLSERVQRVKVGSAISETVSLTSGCIQGSVVGPTAYVFYMNDSIHPEAGPEGKFKNGNSYEERFNENQVDKANRLINEIYMSVYADDSKFLATSENSEGLQAKLDDFVRWVDRKHMRLNISKCQVLYLGGARNPMKPYYIKGVQLKQVLHCRDLGLEYGAFGGSITFDQTKKKRFAKCMQIARMARSIVSITNDTLHEYVRMWNTYVFPQLYTYSEFFFFESVEECRVIDNIYKDFFSNLTFSVSDVDVVPYPPSVLLKKLSRVRFWRIAQGLSGVDENDVFTFLGSIDLKKQRRVISATRCDGNNFSTMNFTFRHVSWYNYLPRKIGRSWYRFSSYINDPNYVITEFFTPHALDVRDKLINGDLCNIRQRRNQHIQESKRYARECNEQYIQTLRLRFGEDPTDGVDSGVDSDESDDADDSATFTAFLAPNFAPADSDADVPDAPGQQISAEHCHSISSQGNFEENGSQSKYFQPLQFFEDLSLPNTKEEDDQIEELRRAQERILATEIAGCGYQRKNFRTAPSDHVPGAYLEA